jgi:hypothetical protein
VQPHTIGVLCLRQTVLGWPFAVTHRFLLIRERPVARAI